MKTPDLSELQPLIDAELQLIPLHRWDAVDKKGQPAGKRPRDNQWQAIGYPNKDVLTYAKRTGGNVGVRLRDGELILDADPRNYPAGRDCLAEFCEKYVIDLRLYPVVRTGSGGFHIYTRVPPGTRVRKSLPDHPGLDFKGIGGQVVAPGSIHPKGSYYRWDAIELPDLRTLPELTVVALEAIARPLPTSHADVTGPIELADALFCLKQLKVEDYKDPAKWFELMQSFNSATGGSYDGREAFIKWSIADSDFSTHGDEIQGRWDSLTPNKPGGIQVGTLFHHVLEAGGELPEERIPEDLFEAFDEVEEATGDDQSGPPSNRLTAAGNAGRFADQHRGKVLWLAQEKTWLAWNGHHWESDARESALKLAKETAASIYEEASRAPSGKKRIALGGHPKPAMCGELKTGHR